MIQWALLASESLLTGTINLLAGEASRRRQLTHLSYDPALTGNNEGMCWSPLDYVFQDNFRVILAVWVPLIHRLAFKTEVRNLLYAILSVKIADFLDENCLL